MAALTARLGIDHDGQPHYFGKKWETTYVSEWHCILKKTNVNRMNNWIKVLSNQDMPNSDPNYVKSCYE